MHVIYIIETVSTDFFLFRNGNLAENVRSILMRIYILDWVNLLKGGRHFKGTIFQEHKISKFCCDISFFFTCHATAIWTKLALLLRLR